MRDLAYSFKYILYTLLSPHFAAHCEQQYSASSNKGLGRRRLPLDFIKPISRSKVEGRRGEVQARGFIKRESLVVLPIFN